MKPASLYDKLTRGVIIKHHICMLISICLLTKKSSYNRVKNIYILHHLLVLGVPVACLICQKSLKHIIDDIFAFTCTSDSSKN